MQKGVYEHYKGGKYQLIDTVKHSETEELMVLYRTMYGDQDLWVRPYTMFFENVMVGSQEIPRFKYIGEADE
jgi:hypothetical protein